nr:MAG: DNA pilot protein [Microvirus sp.]
MSWLGAIGGVAQSFINRETDRRNMIRQNEMNMKMSDLEYKRNLELWNMNNQYNTPKAQMARYGDAGLNPNLIYGQGSSGNSGSIFRYQAPEQRATRQPIDVMGALSAYQDVRMKQAQTNNVEQQNRNIKLDGDLKQKQLDWVDRLNAVKEGLTSQQIQTMWVNRQWDEQEVRRWFEQKEDGKWYIKPELEEIYKEILSAQATSKMMQPTMELERTQAQVAGQNTLNEIRGKELEFLNTGGKYFNTIFQLLRFLKSYQ